MTPEQNLIVQINDIQRRQEQHLRELVQQVRMLYLTIVGATFSVVAAIILARVLP